MDKVNSNNYDSKKIFFLYPYTKQEEIIIKNVVKNEFEAFQLNDHQNHNALLHLLEEYNDSFLFINIDSRLKIEDWKLYINAIIDNPKTGGVKIGAVTAKEIIENFHETFKEYDLPMGKINLKDENNSPVDHIIECLNKHNAKGRRKYIRVACDEFSHSTFSVKHKKSIHAGKIIDISSAGMACEFDEHILIDNGFYFDDIQLRLKGSLVKLSGKLVGIREIDKENIFIIMFDFLKTPKEKEKIHDFIYFVLQKKLMEKLKKIEKT